VDVLEVAEALPHRLVLTGEDDEDPAVELQLPERLDRGLGARGV
jgi:hypothetical protein